VVDIERKKKEWSRGGLGDFMEGNTKGKKEFRIESRHKGGESAIGTQEGAPEKKAPVCAEGVTKKEKKKRGGPRTRASRGGKKRELANREKNKEKREIQEKKAQASKKKACVKATPKRKAKSGWGGGGQPSNSHNREGECSKHKDYCPEVTSRSIVERIPRVRLDGDRGERSNQAKRANRPFMVKKILGQKKNVTMVAKSCIKRKRISARKKGGDDGQTGQKTIRDRKKLQHGGS